MLFVFVFLGVFLAVDVFYSLPLMIYNSQRYRGYRFKCPEIGSSSSTQWSYSIATQYGKDKWQLLGCKASSCTLVWASHLLIILSIHQQEDETLWKIQNSSHRLQKDHYFLIIATRAILYPLNLEISLQDPYCTWCVTRFKKTHAKKKKKKTYYILVFIGTSLKI